MSGKTLYDKLWEAHEVRTNDDGTSILYIDRTLGYIATGLRGITPGAPFAVARGFDAGRAGS